MSQPRKKIAVLLAAYNGKNWIKEQLDSILAQNGVVVTVFISVDASSDGTEYLVDKLAEDDSRLVVLAHNQQFYGAARNFFRIVREVNFSDFDFISFADQDDIWLPNKLLRAHELMTINGVDAYSSNVMAFWPNGQQRLIKKSQPQVKWDFLFESAGPGCTFLMTPWLINQVKHVLSHPISAQIANNVALHDWLTYSICRASGRLWYIDDYPSVYYRQHANNVVGANSGIKAKLYRLKKMSDGWYRAEVYKIVQVCMTLSDDSDFKKIAANLEMNNFVGRLGLLRFMCQARRSFKDRCLLTLSIFLGVF